MGTTESKKAQAKIDSDFKPLRKYCDPLYGQITVLLHKKSRQQLALIQKHIANPSRFFLEHLSARKIEIQSKQTTQIQSCLLKLYDYFDCEIGMCSVERNFFFILEYSTHTFFTEISQRQQQQKPFSFQQLISFHIAHCQFLIKLNELESSDNSIQRLRQWGSWQVSNSLLLYDCSTGQLRGLQPELRCQPQGHEMDFDKLQGLDDIRTIYLAPESYLPFCKNDKNDAKQMAARQQAVVFTLGMNFIEAAILADLSDLYSPISSQINFVEIKDVLSQIKHSYSQEYSTLLTNMLEYNSRQRPRLREVISSLRFIQKKRFNNFFLKKKPIFDFLQNQNNPKQNQLQNLELIPQKQQNRQKKSNQCVFMNSLSLNSKTIASPEKQLQPIHFEQLISKKSVANQGYRGVPVRLCRIDGNK